MSLLEQVMKRDKSGARASKAVTDEHVALAQAWADGAVSITSIMKTLELDGNGAYRLMAFALAKSHNNQKG